MIRPFTPEDYPTLARIASAAFPEYPSSAGEKEFGDMRRDSKCRHGRWLIEREGRAVDYGEYSQGSGSCHPRRFRIREYWRYGIVLALKVSAIAWAKENGYPSIKTWNEANNRGILGINEQLGFVRQPAWLDMMKVLKEESE